MSKLEHYLEEDGMVIARASPFDLNEWERLGNKGWGYNDVLPYYKKMEKVLEPELASNDFRGVDGPWHVRFSHKFPATDIFLQGGKESGLNNTDYFGPNQGFGRVQINMDAHGRRSSTAASYITPILGRRNLKIQAFVTKIQTKSKKARGVRFTTNGQTHTVKVKREVILSAGSLVSPQLLMLSGIGPKTQLQSFGIKVKKDLPVGEYLLDRFLLKVTYTNTGKPITKSILTFKDMFEYMFTGKGPWATPGVLVNGLFRAKNQPIDNKSTQLLISPRQILPTLSKPLVDDMRQNNRVDPQLLQTVINNEPQESFSIWYFHLSPRTVGNLKLRSKDPFDNPKITIDYLKDNKDIEDLIEGVKLANQIMTTNAFRNAGVNMTVNKVPGCGDDINSDIYWECVIQKTAQTPGQIMSTCRMGIDETAVVDYRLRVKGIRGLRVVDAYIIPTSISGNPMTQVIMIAEKAADMIKEDKK